MHWSVAAPYTADPDRDRWLVPFVPGNSHQFTLIPSSDPRASWHSRSRLVTGAAEWVRTFRQADTAWRAADGVVTVFPPLALASGLLQRVAGRRKPVVAWCFNLGALYEGARGALARAALARVDRFVVHASAEVNRYAEWLRLPRERFTFVHLQRPRIAIDANEDRVAPFVLSMGSARRDYATLFAAVGALKIRVVVVAAPWAVHGLDIPANVELRSGLSAVECLELARQARVNVVPVANQETASGQVTITEAMQMGRAIVATRCIGSEDYLQDGHTGLLVTPGAIEELRSAIERLWESRDLRERLGRNAASFFEENCSDQVAGRRLAAVLDEVAAGPNRAQPAPSALA